MNINKTYYDNLKVYLTFDIKNNNEKNNNNNNNNNNKFNNITKLFYYNDYKTTSLDLNIFKENKLKFSNNLIKNINKNPIGIILNNQNSKYYIIYIKK
jgi:hypothetical protein